MAWFADGFPCTYFGHQSKRLIAVGWLEEYMPYATGSLRASDAQALRQLASFKPFTPWTPYGYHLCSLCSDEKSARRGLHNLLVPDAPRLWVAPELLHHYVGAHAYQPPEPFVRAVRAALSMDQQAYTSTCCDILTDIQTAPVDPLPPDFPVDPGAFIYRHWLVPLLADGRSEPREMKEGANVIGQLPEGSVTLQVKRGEARLQPPAPGSCRVDGSPVGSAVTMTNGEVIEIGATRYRYRLEARRRRTPAEGGSP